MYSQNKKLYYSSNINAISLYLLRLDTPCKLIGVIELKVAEDCYNNNDAPDWSTDLSFKSVSMATDSRTPVARCGARRGGSPVRLTGALRVDNFAARH